MSARGSFGGRGPHRERQSDWRGNQAAPFYNEINPAHNGILGPDLYHGHNNGHNYNMGRSQMIPPPPPHLGNYPQGSAQFGNSNTAPYQITLSFNAPTPENSYQNPAHPSQNSFYPFQSNHAMANNDPPPLYNSYGVKPPQSSHLHANEPTKRYSDRAENFVNEGLHAESPGRGKGSRMRGFNSKSCFNLSTPRHNDSAGADSHESGNSNPRPATRGRGQGRERGQNSHHYDVAGENLHESGNSNPRPATRGRGQGRERGQNSHHYDVAGENLHESGNSNLRPATRGRGQGRRRGHFEPQRGNGRKITSEESSDENNNDDNSDSVYNKKGKKGTKREDVPVAAKPKAKPKEQGKVEELFVTLNFDMCFDNAGTLKRHIQSSLKFAEGDNFELSYVEIFLRRCDDESFCKVIISGHNISKAKLSVRKMVSSLRQKLDIDIKYEWSRSSDKNEGCESKRNLPTENDGDTAAASKKSNEKENCGTSKPIPTTVPFKVNKSFPSHECLKKYLRKATSHLPFNFNILDNSMSLSAQFSECVIQTNSKADAKRLRSILAKLQNLEQHNSESSARDKESKNSSKQNAVKTQLEQTRTTMGSKKSAFLQEHDDKISKLKIKCKNAVFCEMSKEAEMDFHALQDKLGEALKQRELFLAQYGVFDRKLETMDFPTGSDISHWKHLFDLECNRLISALPIYAHRDKIIQNVKSNQVTILTGENGCGKTTQIAQYLYDAGYADKGTIVCTQPDHLSAISVAEKVAKEMSVKVGTLVGHKTDRDIKRNSSTKILFATDHSLLNECVEDPELKKYSCIIVDEAHEHSLHTDLLMGMIKYHLSKRRDLKVILLLPANQSDVFVKYFKVNQGLKVSGRNFVVDVFYAQYPSEDFEDYESKVVSEAIKVHGEENEGDILVFLSLPVETLRCCQEFEKRCQGDNSFKCMPLHNDLPPQELRKVYEKLPKNQRKVVFATKYAETLSIHGVRYIIDSGVTSETKYDPKQKISLVKTCVISQNSAIRRQNCAGHSVGGKCYRLFSKEGFDSLAMTKVPEVLRVHLEKAVLKLFEFGVNLRVYEFIHAPSEMAVQLTLETLTQYGAINGNKITEVGKWISKLPFDPKLGFLICEADKKALLYDGIVLATIVSSGSDFSYRTFFETEAATEARNLKLFDCEKMDSFAWFQVYKTWNEVPKKEKSDWCRSHSVNYKLISSVHLCIEDVRSILLKDFDKPCSGTFSSRTDALVTLKKLYLKSKHPHFSTL